MSGCLGSCGLLPVSVGAGFEHKVPDLFGVYRSAGLGPMLMLVGLGAGVGIAQICFGLGVAAIGIALNFAIAIGISTRVGSLVPLFSQQSHLILTPKGYAIMGGVAFAAHWNCDLCHGREGQGPRAWL